MVKGAVQGGVECKVAVQGGSARWCGVQGGVEYKVVSVKVEMQGGFSEGGSARWEGKVG